MKNPSYEELAILVLFFQKEKEERGIVFPDKEKEEEAQFDFVQQYMNDPDTDPHIRCLEGITCEKEVYEVDWDSFYG